MTVLCTQSLNLTYESGMESYLLRENILQVL